MKILILSLLLINLLFSNDLDIANKYVNELIEKNSNNMSKCVDSNNSSLCIRELSIQRNSLLLINNILEKQSNLSKQYLCVKAKSTIQYNIRDINDYDKILALVKNNDQIEILSNDIYHVNTYEGKKFEASFVNFNNTIGLLSNKAIGKCD